MDMFAVRLAVDVGFDCESCLLLLLGLLDEQLLSRPQMQSLAQLCSLCHQGVPLILVGSASAEQVDWLVLWQQTNFLGVVILIHLLNFLLNFLEPLYSQLNSYQILYGPVVQFKITPELSRNQQAVYHFTYIEMGFVKVVLTISVPIAAMTYAAFSLGSRLPIATRKFGNYIGLSYIYFKTTLKALKPEDQMPYDMMQMVRKASQQSLALKRELSNTMKKAKDDFRQKHEETLNKLDKKILEEEGFLEKREKEENSIGSQQQTRLNQSFGSNIMLSIEQTRKQLQEKKKLKLQSRKFYEEL